MQTDRCTVALTSLLNQLHDEHVFFDCSRPRYLQRVVCHPSLLQDPDVREFLEKEEVGFNWLGL